MPKTKILVICQVNSILEVIVRLINKNETWEADGVNNEQEAIKLFFEESYNLVLIGSGISSQSETNIVNTFRIHTPEIKIIQHLGGGSGLLSNEIIAALENNLQGNFNITENQL